MDKEFLKSITCGAVIVTIIGLLIVLPMVLTIKISAWFLLLYMPIVGGFIGLTTYLDEGENNT